MKALFLILGVAAGTLGAAFGYPLVSPKLNAGLGDQDLLPLAPLARGSVIGSTRVITVAGSDRLTLKSSTGKVSRLTADGEWSAFPIGESISDGEQVRTDSSSTALLVGGTSAEATLAESSHLAIGRVTPSGVRLRLTSGLVTLKAGGLPFVIETRSGRSNVESAGGAAILADAERVVAACTEGSLSVTSGTDKRAISSGETIAFRDGASTEHFVPADSKVEISLKPLRQSAAEHLLTVEGSVTPGARVIVAGVQAAADDGGAFSAKVKLHPGSNPIEIVAQLVSGADKRITLPAVDLPAASPTPAKTKRARSRSEGMQWGER